MIFHHREVFKTATRSFYFAHLISKYIKTKNPKKCLDRLNLLLKKKINNVTFKKPVKDAVNDMISKYKVEEH